MTVSPADILAASILIVDDQESNVDLLETLLSENGYTTVSSTTNPEEVSALYQKNKYDLILLDLQMPVMDGFQVMDGLKACIDGNYLPILVITAQPGHKLHALQSGAKDFISKPFDIIEVSTRIHNMLEVRLLYKKLDEYNRTLEKAVAERTVELKESEERYRSLTELASDWYWEQDEHMQFSKVSGPVREMLDLQDAGNMGWNDKERAPLLSKISERQPFLDYIVSRKKADGKIQQYQVSGEPMFDRTCRFIGFRGIGIELGNG